MKKRLFIIIPITSMLLVPAVTATYFMEDIFNLIEAVGLNFSAILPTPDFEILLYLSFVGIFGIHRNRGDS